MLKFISIKQVVWATLLSATLMVLVVSTSAVGAKKPSKGNTIVSTAVAINSDSGEFNTLISAVVNLGLADALSGNRPYTVFAPTDDAFAKLGLNASSFENLTADEKATFRNIVLYHVTNGKRKANSIVGNKSIRMVNGQRAQVNGTNIAGANIISTDVKASNGIIHVVDSVLLP